MFTLCLFVHCSKKNPGRVAPGFSLIQSPLCSHQFSGVIGFIFFLELTAAVLAVVFQDPLRDWISDFFLANVKAYREDIDLQNLIDSLQRLVRLCVCVCVYLFCGGLCRPAGRKGNMLASDPERLSCLFQPFLLFDCIFFC